MRNSFKFLIAGVLLAFGTVASAVTVDPVVFEFDGAGGIGSTLVENQDGSVVGSGINIDAIFVTTGGVRTEYAVDSGVLNFDTGAGTDGTLSIVGSADSIFGTGLNSITLFSGNVAGSFSVVNGFNVFTGTGGGGVDAAILSTLGIPNGAFSFYAFTLGIDNVGVITADITATQDNRTPEVPIPAAAWLFGSGLLGLVGVARRKV